LLLQPSCARNDPLPSSSQLSSSRFHGWQAAPKPPRGARNARRPDANRHTAADRHPDTDAAPPTVTPTLPPPSATTTRTATPPPPSATPTRTPTPLSPTRHRRGRRHRYHDGRRRHAPRRSHRHRREPQRSLRRRRRRLPRRPLHARSSRRQPVERRHLGLSLHPNSASYVNFIGSTKTLHPTSAPSGKALRSASVGARARRSAAATGRLPL